MDRDPEADRQLGPLAALQTRQHRSYRFVCRIFFRRKADDSFRYIQTQRFWRLPAIGDSLVVRDINGAHACDR
jgi:hypothetical protein